MLGADRVSCIDNEIEENLNDSGFGSPKQPALMDLIYELQLNMGRNNIQKKFIYFSHYHRHRGMLPYSRSTG